MSTTLKKNNNLKKKNNNKNKINDSNNANTLLNLSNEDGSKSKRDLDNGSDNWRTNRLPNSNLENDVNKLLNLNNKENFEKKKSSKPKREVLLGYIDDSTEQQHLDPFTSKLGGKPDWITKMPLKFDEYGKCKHCLNSMCFVTQLYAPLMNSPYDRTLYVFACIEPKCAGKMESIKILRGMKLNKEYSEILTKKKKKKDSTKSINKNKPNISFGDVWGKNVNLSNEKDDRVMEELNVNMENLLIDNNKKEITKNNENLELDDHSEDWFNNLLLLPSYYIATEEEYIDLGLGNEGIEEDILNDDLVKKYKNLIEQFQNNPNIENEEQEEEITWSGEQYEKSVKLVGADKTFLKFSARISKNPEQILSYLTFINFCNKTRYDLGGDPLLYTRVGQAADLLLGIPSNFKGSIKRNKLPIILDNLEKCSSCGANRVFEFQLMPNILSSLPFDDISNKNIEQNQTLSEKEAILNSSSWEFGTILIFTCKNNCLPKNGGYTSELGLIQLEP
ncbi:hypothetical protein K502DRAFT_350866 [Neoconidiobolus thromboides FSU 785]|nr:hypothetical protein K502DRAFT_350866 [Neoconidiobolus thromboides FSU 785]